MWVVTVVGAVVRQRAAKTQVALVIPSAARDLAWEWLEPIRTRSLAALGMTVLHVATACLPRTA